jgi:parallel beta-helix repeat protein
LVAVDTTFDASGGPYTVLGRIEVSPGATLTIAPGTQLRFTGLYYLLVHGKLMAQGSDGNRILFTSDKATPARGDWGGIYFYDDSDDASTLSYATIEYAQSYSIYCANASPTIDHVIVQEGSDRGMYLTSESKPTVSQSTFQNNTNYGIYMDGGSDAVISDCMFTGNRYGIFMINSSPAISGCTVDSNTNYGIWVQNNSAPAIADSTITNNNTYGIYLQGNNSVFTNPRPVINANRIHSNGNNYDFYTWDFGGDRLDTQVDATGNWWGTDNPRTIGQRIHDYNDNVNEGPVVNFLDFLDDAGGSPVAGTFLLAQRIFNGSTWTQSASPVTIVGRLFLINGAELTIEPEVEVQVAGPYDLHVHGKLTAAGAQGSMITFTSDKTEPARGDWELSFMTTATIHRKFHMLRWNTR